MARVEMEIDSVRRNSFNNEWSVILKEKVTGHYLPIYVGSRQANLISRELQAIGYAELENYILLLTGVDTASCQVGSVIIDNFDNNVFYGKLTFIQHGKRYETDCPLAEALTLAVRVGTPVFAEEEVLSKAGIKVSAYD